MTNPRSNPNLPINHSTGSCIIRCALVLFRFESDFFNELINTFFLFYRLCCDWRVLRVLVKFWFVTLSRMLTSLRGLISPRVWMFNLFSHHSLNSRLFHQWTWSGVIINVACVLTLYNSFLKMPPSDLARIRLASMVLIISPYSLLVFSAAANCLFKSIIVLSFASSSKLSLLSSWSKFW